MKIKFLFLLFLFNNEIFGRSSWCHTEPVLLQPQCDKYTAPACITYPAEGQIFTTDTCIAGCALCVCNNGFSCEQRALENLTVRGTTIKPNMMVTVVLINSKLSAGDIDLTFQLVTTSKPAPDGTGVWSVTFTSGIVTPRPAPFTANGIPTTISVSVAPWSSNFVTRSIFIRKNKICNTDCDIVCRRHFRAPKLCKLHIYDSLTKAIRNKYTTPKS